MIYSEHSRDYYRIEKAILYLKNNSRSKDVLKKTAEHLSLSESRFEHLFKRWAGISPKKFVQYISKEEILKNLYSADSILQAAVRSDLSSQSRLYDLFVNMEAATPGEIRSGGKGLKIEYGTHKTPFGNCQIAVTRKGICSLIFLGEDKEYNPEYLRKHWRNAKIVKNQGNTSDIVKSIFDSGSKSSNPFNLHVKGTNFQVKVWEALLRIPTAGITSYEQIAAAADNPKAVRAAASAIAANPVSYLIPCHRVIRKNGIINNYRWGAERKKAMIAWEQSKAGNNS